MMMEKDHSLYHAPPQNIEAEESIIGSILIDSTVFKEVKDILAASDFYRSAHQKIFQAFVDIDAKEKSIDLVTVTDHLRNSKYLEGIGGAAYLANLMDTVPFVTNAEEYAMIVHKKACLRQLIERSSKIAKKCFECHDDDVQGLINEAERDIKAIEYKDPGMSEFTNMQDLTTQSIDRYEEIQANRGNPSGIITGYRLLDHLTCGLQKTDLILLAARPSIGKTSLAMNIVRKLGSEDIPVGVFSLEMSKHQLFDKMVSSKTNINLQKFRSGNFSGDDWIKMTDAAGDLNYMPIYIDDTGALHYSQICHKARKLKEKYDIKIMFVDHMQLIQSDSGLTRDREIGRISGAMKALAKELDIPVVVLSQLNRKLEDRPHPYKRPRLSDLRDSGTLEQDSDVVVFMYRHEYYLNEEEKENHPDRGIAELNIAKQRNGPTGMIKLQWVQETTTFHNIDNRYE